MAQPLIQYDFKHNGERLLHMLRQQHPEYHPIVSIARIAHHVENQEEPDYSAALRAHAIILKYVEPELKSVEVNVNADRKRVINVSLFEEVPTELLANEPDKGYTDMMDQLLIQDIVIEEVSDGQEQGQG